MPLHPFLGEFYANNPEREKKHKKTNSSQSSLVFMIFFVSPFFGGARSFCIFTSKFSLASFVFCSDRRRVSCQTLRFSARPKVALPPLLPFLPSKRRELICSQVTKNLGWFFFAWRFFVGEVLWRVFSYFGCLIFLGGFWGILVNFWCFGLIGQTFWSGGFSIAVSVFGKILLDLGKFSIGITV